MSYRTVDDLRAAATETARSCADCSVTELDVFGGAATRFGLCEAHHREFYRRYADRQRDEGLPDASVEDLAEGVADADAAAASGLAALAREDPGQIRPAADALFEAVRSQRGGGFVDTDLIAASSQALARAGTVDEAVRARLFDLLDDEDPIVRQYGAAAVAEVAKFAPEAMLDTDPDAAREPDDGGGGLLSGIFGRSGGSDEAGGASDAAGDRDGHNPVVCGLVTLADDENAAVRDPAVGALGELARARPAAVLDHVDVLAERLDDDSDGVRFSAAVALANVALASPGRVMPHARRLAELTHGEAETVVGAAIIALTYLSREGLETDRSVDRLVENVRRLADPSRYPERTVREAVFALGEVGDEGDIERLEWIESAAVGDDLRVAAGSVRDRLGE